MSVSLLLHPEVSCNSVTRWEKSLSGLFLRHVHTWFTSQAQKEGSCPRSYPDFWSAQITDDRNLLLSAAGRKCPKTPMSLWPSDTCSRYPDPRKMLYFKLAAAQGMSHLSISTLIAESGMPATHTDRDTSWSSLVRLPRPLDSRKIVGAPLTPSRKLVGLGCWALKHQEATDIIGTP